ncbi:adenosylhomocysteine nucleosidase [Croceifilum oryzae]|uniref:adenosylhomocysteine nucleosidase n=1 Tax=Croceifilum oryzae TaxID=1553429 RepID=A0AAJ1WSG4_9BACL|nr:5'-methylthioadenosine/adenosylhomocysteine nucleosidase [Croceifilum oryzae]MDQ0417685.1 adenosylhomocysteine nucleosidase [Croceifilum oryzae]
MKIGIIGAMDSEIARFLEDLTEKQVHQIHGFSYYEGMMAGREVVITKSGVGKVNAAICATTLISHFQVKSVLFTGVAGAVHPDLEIGDIVVSSECQYHDVDVTALGFVRGQIPFQETSIFPADPALVQWAEEAGQEMDGVQVKVGKVLSGDQFISSVEAVHMLREELQGACVEMEGAAVAHVCFMLKTPFIVIRSMSDRADHSAHVNFEEFTILAADRSYTMVSYLLHKIA